MIKSTKYKRMHYDIFINDIQSSNTMYCYIIEHVCFIPFLLPFLSVVIKIIQPMGSRMIVCLKSFNRRPKTESWHDGDFVVIGGHRKLS